MKGENKLEKDLFDGQSFGLTWREAVYAYPSPVFPSVW